MSYQVTFYGHGTFGVKIKEYQLLIDPFLSGNPSTKIKPDDVKPDYILITHGHGDHIGDAVEIVKRTGAKVIANAEVAKWMGDTSVYKIEVGWAAVGWNDSEATGWSRLEYEEIADGNLPTDRVFPSERVTINPDVHIRVGVPARLHIHASFDRETREVVAVQLMPGR